MRCHVHSVVEIARPCHSIDSNTDSVPRQINQSVRSTPSKEIQDDGDDGDDEEEEADVFLVIVAPPRASSPDIHELPDRVGPDL